MYKFQGEKQIALPLAIVWSKLSNARFLVQCIPDVHAVSKAEPDEAVLTIRPGLAFVHGTLDVKVRISERVPTTQVKVLLHSKGIGATSAVETVLNLSETTAGTWIQWVAEVTELGGLLKLVPGGLIRGAAEKVIRSVWDQAVEKLKSAPAD